MVIFNSSFSNKHQYHQQASKCLSNNKTNPFDAGTSFFCCDCCPPPRSSRSVVAQDARPGIFDAMAKTLPIATMFNGSWFGFKANF